MARGAGRILLRRELEIGVGAAASRSKIGELHHRNAEHAFEHQPRAARWFHVAGGRRVANEERRHREDARVRIAAARPRPERVARGRQELERFELGGVVGRDRRRKFPPSGRPRARQSPPNKGSRGRSWPSPARSRASRSSWSSTSCKNDLPLTELVTANYGDRQSLLGDDVRRARTPSATRSSTPIRRTTRPSSKPIQLCRPRRTTCASRAGGGYPHAGILSMPSCWCATRRRRAISSARAARALVLERMLGDAGDEAVGLLDREAAARCGSRARDAGIRGVHGVPRGDRSDRRPLPELRQQRPVPRRRRDAARRAPARRRRSSARRCRRTTRPTRCAGSAQQVAQHERFGLGVLMPVLADLIGTEILTPPSDIAARTTARATSRSACSRSRSSACAASSRARPGCASKPLVKAIVKGPFFRAVGSAAADEIDARGARARGRRAGRAAHARAARAQDRERDGHHVP